MKRSYLCCVSFALILLSAPLLAQGIMVPAGSGAWGNQLYVSGSVTNKQAYSPEPGGILSLGFGIGNPKKNIGLQVNGNLLHLQSQYTLDVKLHRYLGYGTSMAIGGRNIWTYGMVNDWDNYYLVMSHDLKYNFSPHNLFSRLAFSLGGGFGTSVSTTLPKDIIRKKREDGTFLFGALQVKLSKHLYATAEWTGINLNSFITYQRTFNRFPIGVFLGAADLTPYSGDRIFFMGGMSASYQFR